MHKKRTKTGIGEVWLSAKSVYDFKKKWGAVDYPYHYLIKVYDNDLKNFQKFSTKIFMVFIQFL